MRHAPSTQRSGLTRRAPGTTFTYDKLLVVRPGAGDGDAGAPTGAAAGTTKTRGGRAPGSSTFEITPVVGSRLSFASFHEPARRDRTLDFWRCVLDYVERDRTLRDYELRIVPRDVQGQESFAVLVAHGAAQGAGGRVVRFGSVCRHCDPLKAALNNSYPPVTAADLLVNNEWRLATTVRVSLDLDGAAGRYVVTPVEHHERVAELTDDELLLFLRQGIAVYNSVSTRPGHRYRALVIANGRYRRTPHLTLDVDVADLDDFRRRWGRNPAWRAVAGEDVAGQAAAEAETAAATAAAVGQAGALVTHRGGCHCRAVRFEVDAPARIVAWDCTCSVCRMKRNTHFVVPKSRFRLTHGRKILATYQFGTRVAEHTFCSVCGICAFYTPRSNPDGVAVTAHCLDPGTVEGQETRTFDGANWEAAFATSTIKDMSKEEGKEREGKADPAGGRGFR